MSGVLPRFQSGPRTYKVNSAVKGGQVVQARTDGTIEPAAAASAKVLGVALGDAAPRPDQSSSTTSYGAPVVDMSVLPEHTGVAYAGEVMPVTYAANAAFGVKLKAAANGQVTPWTTGTDAADLIIGTCDEPAGVASGAVGLMRTA